MLSDLAESFFPLSQHFGKFLPVCHRSVLFEGWETWIKFKILLLILKLFNKFIENNFFLILIIVSTPDIFLLTAAHLHKAGKLLSYTIGPNGSQSITRKINSRRSCRVLLKSEINMKVAIFQPAKIEKSIFYKKKTLFYQH